MGRMTNEEVLKMARKAAAHTAAGVEGVEIFAPALEKAMWELLLLRKREADRAKADAGVVERFPSAARLLDDVGPIPQHIDPKSDQTLAISTGYMENASRTCPGTIKALRERHDSERFSLPGDEQ